MDYTEFIEHFNNTIANWQSAEKDQIRHKIIELEHSASVIHAQILALHVAIDRKYKTNAI